LSPGEGLSSVCATNFERNCFTGVALVFTNEQVVLAAGSSGSSDLFAAYPSRNRCTVGGTGAV
jgi:hypothetical protein